MTEPLTILGAGMVTGVGLSASASCAAIRCGINNFRETAFVDRTGTWIVGSQVSLPEPSRGTLKLAKMAASAIAECLESLSAISRVEAPIPLVLCVAEEDRPGRLAELGGPLLFEIEQELGIKFHAESSIVAQGRVGGAVAFLRAQKLIGERGHAYVLLAGVDSYLTASVLEEFEERDRLLTTDNSDGFIPGEAGACILLGRDSQTPTVASLTCYGIGFALESATIKSGLPLRADGLVDAVRAALAAAGTDLSRVDCRISDLSGEQYRFKEAALVVSRLLRQRKADFDIWHPADCVGEVGAAALPIMLGVLHFGSRKGYLPGPTFLGHLSNDDEKRAAFIVSARRPG